MSTSGLVEQGLASMNLNDDLAQLPSYHSSPPDSPKSAMSVASVGSSVSQTKNTTVEVSAAMYNTAMSVLLKLQEDHYNLQKEVSIQFIIFRKSKLTSILGCCLEGGRSQGWPASSPCQTSCLQEQQCDGLVFQD